MANGTTELVAYVALENAGLCLSCEKIFPLADDCPCCGDRTIVLLASWIEPLRSLKAG